MKKTKTWILVSAPILILFVIAIFIYVLKSYEYNLPEKKANPFVKMNLPPPRSLRGPRMPSDSEIKFPGIAIIVMNDRTVCFNDNEDPVDWNLLEEKLRDIYSIRTDKSIRIIKEDKAFQEDFLIVMGIVKRLGLEVKEIITLEKGQVVIPEDVEWFPGPYF
jgi:biopolymer transport protein ExbD